MLKKIAKLRIIFFSSIGGCFGFVVVVIILPIKHYLNSIFPNVNMGNVFCFGGEIAILGTGLMAVILFYKEGLAIMFKAGIISFLCYFCYLLLLFLGEIVKVNYGWFISLLFGIFFGSFYYFITGLVLLLFPSPKEP